jgi:hypothetical protein
MRCSCCNKNLSDYESTLRHPETKEFLDICNKCLKDIPITPIEGVNSVNTQHYDEEEDIVIYHLKDKYEIY